MLHEYSPPKGILLHLVSRRSAVRHVAHNCSFVGFGKPRRLLSHSEPPRCQSTGTPAQPARACSRPLLVRTRKARLMDDTYKFIKDTYGGNVKFTTGHSQAGFDSAYSQREFFPEAEVINFNPAPKGVVPRDIGRSWVTPNDVVSLSGKLKKITNPNQYDINPNRFYPNQTVKSTAILAALRPS